MKTRLTCSYIIHLVDNLKHNPTNLGITQKFRFPIKNVLYTRCEIE